MRHNVIITFNLPSIDVSPYSGLALLGLAAWAGIVLVQREMESGRFAIASVPPLRGGDFQGMGKSIEVEEEGEDGG